MLTDRQIRFVAARGRGLNATDAAAEAGYTGGRAALRTAGWRLMKHPQVVAALEARIGAAAAAIEADPDIAGPAEQQKILTAIARSEETPAEVRIKAIAALAKLTAPKVTMGPPAGAVASAQVVVVVDNGRGPSLAREG